MNLMAELNRPLLKIDRRNRKLKPIREKWAGQEGLRAVSNGEQKLESVPYITMLRLGITLVIAMTVVGVPLFKLMDSWNQSATDKKIAAAIAQGFMEADRRYVSGVVYDLKHQELAAQVLTVAKQMEQAEIQRKEMAQQLYEIKYLLEKNSQKGLK